MVNTAFATQQTQVGLGIETTRGTPATTMLWMPILPPKYSPKLTMITDNTLQGVMAEVNNVVPGMRYDEYEFDGYPRLDSFPLLLRAIFGSTDTLTAAATTTLSASAVAGATTVTVASATGITAGTRISIGTGSSLESHLVTAVETTTLTISPGLVNGQASGAAVATGTQHKFSLLNNAGTGNQPPSLTIMDYDGDQWRQMVAAQLSKLTIKGTATGLVQFTATFDANAATTPTTPSVSYTTSTQAVPGWTTTASIGGSQIAYLEDWEVDYDRKVTEIPALTGTQNYYMHFAGPLAPTAKLTVVEQSGSPELDEYLSGAGLALDISVADIASGDSLDLHFSSAKFTTGSLDRTKPYVEAQLDVQPLPSASDATAGGTSPGYAVVSNGQTTSY